MVVLCLIWFGLVLLGYVAKAVLEPPAPASPVLGSQVYPTVL
jgi:hypothetical protein